LRRIGGSDCPFIQKQWRKSDLLGQHQFPAIS
jgi:hypothetical protein